MPKYTPSAVETELKKKIAGFHDRAVAAKKDYYARRQEILDNDRLSPSAQHEDIAKLTDEVAETLAAIKGEQDAYVSNLKSNIEKELRGSQPMDANSILLRRDAADRARKITDEKEALAVMADAVWSGDESLAHAIGHVARQSGWVSATDAYRASYPSSADAATALAYVEEFTSGGGWNLANGAAYSNPSV